MLLGLLSPGTPVWLLLALVLGKGGAMACGFVALYSKLMGLSSPRQTGVDFTLFQCADAGIAMAMGYGSGLLAQQFGYGVCFASAALLALGGLPVIALLLRRPEVLVRAEPA